MRCLLVADIHYSLPQFDWLAQVAPQFDLVVVAGDLLDLSSMVDFSAQILVAQKYIRRIATLTRLIVCSGNHDLDRRDADNEKIASWIAKCGDATLSVDGASIVLDGILFTICPWWDGPLTRARIEMQLAEDSLKRTGRWIWVHHAPPTASQTSWAGTKSLGDKELEQWIATYKPDLVLSGHVHQSPFVRGGSWADLIGTTWVFNAGHQYGAPPAHVIFDTSGHRGVWISAMGVQAVDLVQPLIRPIEPLTALPDWITEGADRGRIPVLPSHSAGG
jgi:Icc-related predicted phosphoesterase